MKLTSPAFSYDAVLPQKYSREGDNASPPLEWTEVPSGTRSFALLCEDPDAPGTIFAHWLVWDLPPDVTRLEEGRLPKVAKQGLNDFQRARWDGPAPPAGPYHRYFFRLYALSQPLGLPPKATKDDFREALMGKVLGEAATMARYRKVRFGAAALRR